MERMKACNLRVRKGRRCFLAFWASSSSLTPPPACHPGRGSSVAYCQGAAKFASSGPWPTHHVEGFPVHYGTSKLWATKPVMWASEI